MIMKWNRESFLVTVMAAMILIGIFFYGNQYLINPIKEEAEVLTQTVQNHESLLDAYPPSEELQSDYEGDYSSTKSYLPIGAQANEALITLEQAADQSGVTILSVTRISDQQPIEEASASFVKNTYEVQITSTSPADFRNLINRLMNEDRVWNITAFSYDKVDEANYTDTFNYELAYYSKDVSSSKTPQNEMTDVEETTETPASSMK